MSAGAQRYASAKLSVLCTTNLAFAVRARGSVAPQAVRDATLTALRHFPALDLAGSGTLRADALVGDAGAEAIAKARVKITA